jgi:phosphotriesterase-related protein
MEPEGRRKAKEGRDFRRALAVRRRVDMVRAMGEVETVGGRVDVAELGKTLGHEHLKTTFESVRTQFPHLYDEAEEESAAVEQVERAMSHGVKTLVDPACMDLGRDVRFSQRIAEKTGIQLVMCTGIYGSHYTFIPQAFANKEPEYLVDAFVHDIEEGIQGTDVKAAFLKCAVDEPGITEHVGLVLRAVAEASKRTGAPIMAHSHPGTRRGLEIMDLFDEEGVDPARIVVAHTGDSDDLDYIEELLARGPYIGMDRYGLDIILPTAQRNATVVALCERGHEDRMMLSHDACATIDWFPRPMIAEMAPDWHMGFIFESVLPALHEAGVTEEQTDKMLGANVHHWLAP